MRALDMIIRASSASSHVLTPLLKIWSRFHAMMYRV